MKLLITGAGGFIGAAVAAQAMRRGHEVVGLDNLNDYYDPALKRTRLAALGDMPFHECDLLDRGALDALLGDGFDTVIHLAAQAGVRWCLERPQAYIDSNLSGFANVLEACAHHQVPHLVYASSSSVYGANTKVPFAEGDPTDHPLNLYGATKKANELMARAYRHTHGLRSTGLRFFTVYGPAGRPDMAPLIFASRLLEGRAIRLHDGGEMQRDFTYIDDIVSGVLSVAEEPQRARHEVYNLGGNQPVLVKHFLETLAEALVCEARIESVPRLPAEMERTWADIERMQADFGWQPSTALEDGVRATADWVRRWHKAQPS